MAKRRSATKKGRGGNPPVYSQQTHEAAIRAVLAGGTDDDAAAAAGVTPRCLAYWKARRPRFAQDYAAARQAVVTSSLVTAIEKRTALVNQWIDNVLTGTAIATKERRGPKGEVIYTETTTIIPDRSLIDRVLGNTPQEEFKLSISLAEPPPEPDDDLEEDPLATED